VYEGWLQGGISMGALPPGADLDAILSGLPAEVADAVGQAAGRERPADLR
jgi:hypothetical protein